MPEIQVKDGDEFSRLISGLASDAVTARIHFVQLRDLWGATEEFEREFEQARTFWHLVFVAHLDVVMVRLSRVYDQHKKSLNLRNWLQTIEANLGLFGPEGFVERKSDNPFVKSLAQVDRIPDEDQLSDDLVATSRADPLVLKLIQNRNNLVAHRSADFAKKDRHPAHDFPLGPDDLDVLTERAVDIVNRYSSLFQAETYSPLMLGADDFQSVLMAVRRDLEVQEGDNK